jgi:PTS system mannose-specific IID component
MSSLSLQARIGALLRSLLLQAAWNFERLQNVGFAFCMEPALRELYRDPVERSAARRRHLELFNTHPYMAGYVLGAALRAEEDVAVGRMSADEASAVKLGLAPALAAVGDSFFWATLRPAAAVMGVAWLWLAPHPLHLMAPLVYLGAYNLPGLWLRLHSLQAGYDKGPLVAAHVAGLRLPALTEGLRLSALAAIGGLAGSLARIADPQTGAGVPLVDNFVFLGSGLAMLMLLRLSVRPTTLLGLSVLLTLILGLSLP